jgi:hypothetical protein
MVQRFAAIFRGLDKNGHLLFDSTLANVFIEPHRPQGAVKPGIAAVLNT